MLHSVFSHLLAARKKPATSLAGGVFLRVPGNFESVLSEGNENRGRSPAFCRAGKGVVPPEPEFSDHDRVDDIVGVVGSDRLRIAPEEPLEDASLLQCAHQGP